MDLYLQLGWGMMEHTRHLFERWGGGTAILSPRDLEPEQLERLAAQVRTRDGNVLIDPQFYLPHEQHHRLSSHRFWPDDYRSSDFWKGKGHVALVEDIIALNQRLKTAAVILPSVFAPQLTDEWINRTTTTLDALKMIGGSEGEAYVTLPLGCELIRDRNQVHDLLNATDEWSAEGMYVIPEHPPNEYIVGNPTWLANVLDLIAGLRLRDFEVVLGYANQQMLITAVAAPTALASGTFQNVRSFPPDKFEVSEREPRQRSTWYYVPQALSEFQVTFLDVAYDEGILSDMKADGNCGDEYSAILFEGPRPSAVGFNERSAFRHFLDCLSKQVSSAVQNTFDDTVAHIENMLDSAHNLVDRLNVVGVFGSSRQLGETEYNASRSAVRRVVRNRGPILRRKWGGIGGV